MSRALASHRSRLFSALAAKTGIYTLWCPAGVNQQRPRYSCSVGISDPVTGAPGDSQLFMSSSRSCDTRQSSHNPTRCFQTKQQPTPIRRQPRPTPSRSPLQGTAQQHPEASAKRASNSVAPTPYTGLCLNLSNLNICDRLEDPQALQLCCAALPTHSLCPHLLNLNISEQEGVTLLALFLPAIEKKRQSEVLNTKNGALTPNLKPCTLHPTPTFASCA